MDFIDLQGASGSSYRFRLWPGAGRHPPIAGNLAVVETKTGKVLALSISEDLSQGAVALDAAPKGAQLFTRLNVSRRDREAEHADLALQYPDAASGAAHAHRNSRAA